MRISRRCSYSGGYLQTIEDPASRMTTFTHSGGNLTKATLPDSSTWNYGYASGGQLTQITDPRSHTVTDRYDSASRVATISRPDSTHETFTNFQESGWTNSGTSGSPAAPTLAGPGRRHVHQPQQQHDHDPARLAGPGHDRQPDRRPGRRRKCTTERPTAWRLGRRGPGQPGHFVTYSRAGNMTEEVYPDGNSESYTFNSDSQPLTFTDANGNTTSYTYSGGNLTVIKDPMTNLTTMAYTSTGRLRPRPDANNHTTTYSI